MRFGYLLCKTTKMTDYKSLRLKSHWIWPLTASCSVCYLLLSGGRGSGLCQNQVKGRASFCVPGSTEVPNGAILALQGWSQTRAPGCQYQPVHSSLCLVSSVSLTLWSSHQTSHFLLNNSRWWYEIWPEMLPFLHSCQNLFLLNTVAGSQDED